jgi:hypothetical protein
MTCLLKLREHTTLARKKKKREITRKGRTLTLAGESNSLCPVTMSRNGRSKCIELIFAVIRTDPQSPRRSMPCLLQWQGKKPGFNSVSSDVQHNRPCSTPTGAAGSHEFFKVKQLIWEEGRKGVYSYFSPAKSPWRKLTARRVDFGLGTHNASVPRMSWHVQMCRSAISKG